MAEDAPRDENFVPAALFQIDGEVRGQLMAGRIDEATGRILTSLAGGGAGSVTSVSVVSANGLAGTVANPNTTPAITLSTTITGILQGNGTAISAASTTGSGNVVLATSPTLVTPLLGTPTSGTLTNCTGLPLTTGITGTLGIGNGGTNRTSISALSIWVANSANTLVEVTPGAGNSVRVNGAGNAWEAFTPSSAVPTTITVANEASDTTCFIGFFTAATGDLGPKTNANMTFNSSTGVATFASTVLTTTDINGGTIDGTTIGGASAAAGTFTTHTSNNLLATSNDVGAIGASGTAWADLFLASGGTINWNAGNMVLTHSAGVLTLSDTNPGATGPIFEIFNDSVSPAANDVIGTLAFYGDDSAANKQQYANIATVILDPTSTSEDAKITFGVVTAGTFANELELNGSALYPTTNDGLALGTTTFMFADVFLASGGVINFNNGNVTITHAAASLTVAGATTVSLGTSAAFTTGTIELGAASDTTISRVSAGLIAVEGNEVVVANRTATRTMVLTGAGGWPSTTSGASANTKVEFTTNDQDLYFMDFDQTTAEYSQWTVVMPDSYTGGTITASFYWTANSTSTNSVVWGIQGRAYADGDAIDATWGTAQTVTDANGASAYTVRISAATSAVTLAGSPAGGQLVQFRAYRDAASGSDTLAADARLIAVKIEYPINSYTD